MEEAVSGVGGREGWPLLKIDISAKMQKISDEMERTADVTRSEEHSVLEAELCKQVVFTWICHVKSFHTANKNIYTPGLNHTVNGANNW